MKKQEESVLLYQFSDEAALAIHEAAVFHNIKGKRLDQVLQALKDAGIAHIKFKAVTTPFNLHWTLARLCRTMHKEHAYMMERDKNSE